jgi:hypothetical protein
MAIDCAYVGDSIAVGLQMMNKNCAVHAKVGANAEFIVKHYSNVKAQSYVVISMGSNDPRNPMNIHNAKKLRRTIKAEVVVWILPYNRYAAADIKLVAREFGDSYIDIYSIPSKDGIHPNYRTANKVLNSTLDEVFD